MSEKPSLMRSPEAPIRLEKIEGVTLLSPRTDDLPQIVRLLQNSDSDLRGFALTAHESYETRGKEQLIQSWESTLLELESAVHSEKFPRHIIEQIRHQSQGIINSAYISEVPTEVADPFNATSLEGNQSLEMLQQSQLENTLVAKDGERIIGIGRVLDVEGSLEMVSLAVDADYRQSGIGSELIKQRLQRSNRWPMFSFVKPLAESKPGSLLLTYYLHQYASYRPSIPPFEELPPALQRDLARMNDFWGSYVIVRIDGRDPE